MEGTNSNDSKKKTLVLDIPLIIQIIKQRKKYFAWSLPIAFVIGAVILWSTPKYYSCQVKLAPETSITSNALSSLASSFGLKIANQTSEDAITPEFYPDVMSSTDFMVGLFDVQVETSDGKVKTTYYDYLNNYQACPWWFTLGDYISELINNQDDKDEPESVDPFRLTKKQTSTMRGMTKAISCGVDKKSEVISIFVDDTDALVCATMADSVRQKMQDFITAYRTSKARNDMEYLIKMRDQVFAQYKEAQARYTRFIDNNHDLYSARDRAYRDDLENDVQILANSYNNYCNQIQLTEAKVQANTPVFTILQSATVPMKPMGPKRTLSLLLILLATFILTVFFAIFKHNLENNQI